MSLEAGHNAIDEISPPWDEGKLGFDNSWLDTLVKEDEPVATISAFVTPTPELETSPAFAISSATSGQPPAAAHRAPLSTVHVFSAGSKGDLDGVKRYTVAYWALRSGVLESFDDEFLRRVALPSPRDHPLAVALSDFTACKWRRFVMRSAPFGGVLERSIYSFALSQL